MNWLGKTWPGHTADPAGTGSTQHGHAREHPKAGLATLPITMTQHDPARRHNSVTWLTPTRSNGMETRHDPR